MMTPSTMLGSVLVMLLAVTMQVGVTSATRPLEMVDIFDSASTETHGSVIRDLSIDSVNDIQKDFFLESALIRGGKMTLDENLHDPIPRRPFLAAAAAEKLPALTTANVPQLLNAFDVHEDTATASGVATSAYLCGNPALPGESRSCPASVEALGEYVSTQLGRHVELLATSGAPKTAPAEKAQVTVVDFEIGSVGQGQHIVVCHNVWFPSQLYYCHTVTGTRVVQASLQAADGNIIQAVGICHMDTSLWSSSHPAFAALSIPRGAEACHWTVENDLVWLPVLDSGSDHILPATVV